MTFDAPVIASSRGGAVASSATHDVVDVEGAVAAALDVAAAGDAGPRQQVGVVLDDGGDDDVVGPSRSR